MTWYFFFKFVHVLAAVVWIGGALVLQLFARFALGSDDNKRKAEFAKEAEWIGMRVFMPTSLVLVAVGIAMMENGQSPWSWGMNWLVFALIVFGASFVVGAGFLGPESGRLAKLIEAEGAESPAVAAKIRRILVVSRVELVFLAAVVWAMVVKPVGNAGWFFGALAVTAVVALGVIAQYLASRDAVGAPAAPAAD